MAVKKILTKDQILEAQRRTKSNRAAARYLHVSWPHYKSYSTMYKDEATGKSLHELHANPSGKGIPKFLTYKGKEPKLLDILEGRPMTYPNGSMWLLSPPGSHGNRTGAMHST